MRPPNGIGTKTADAARCTSRSPERDHARVRPFFDAVKQNGLTGAQHANVEAFGMRARVVGPSALAFAKDELDARFAIVADGYLHDRGVDVGREQGSDLFEQLVQRQIGGQQKSRPSHEVPVTF